MKLILTPEDVAQALQFINESEILAYDTETTGLNPRKDRIIGFGVSNATDGFYVPILRYSKESDSIYPVGPSEQLRNTILSTLSRKKLITWNASFDMRFTKFNLGIDLLPALHADVLLMKHTCDEEFPFGLKEVAAKHYGTDVKKEKEEMQASIKANNGTAKQYFKADLDLLSRYCVQDCLLTFRLFNKYSSELKKQNLTSFYYEEEVLPLYKEVTIPMEERGVRLDIPKLEQTLNHLTVDLHLIELRIQQSITPHLELFTNWFLNKDYPMLTKGGKIPQYIKKHGSQAAAWKAEYPTGYMFNLLSKHHLKKLFFDTLKETSLTKTPTGLPQVDEEFIASVADKYPWCKELIVFNKLTKLKGTYIERFLEEAEDGRFYPAFLQHRTVSGRYAGDLQQLPRPVDETEDNRLVAKYTSCIREFFLPDIGAKLVSADYEQLEPSVFAHTSGDAALAEIFNTGKDFYSEVAIRTERLKDVTSDKASERYLGKVNKAARQKAKSYALGIAYGMTGYKLKFEIGVDAETADQLVKDYLNAFPGLARWMNASKDKAVTHGFVKTETGRVRHLHQAQVIFNKYGSRINDDLQLWHSFHDYPSVYAEAKIARKTYKNLLNNAINFQVQGLAASIVNRASIAIARRLKTEGLKAAICMQVHDELVLNVPDEELEPVCTLLSHIMETIVKLTVPLRTVPQIGNNYKECK